MIPDQMNLYTQALEARIKVLEDENAQIKAYLTQQNPAWNMNIISQPAPTGASGTMAVSDDAFEIIGYVVASGNYANVREKPQYSSPLKGEIQHFIQGVPMMYDVYGHEEDIDRQINYATGKPYIWYKLMSGYVREDVVTFSKEKPQPILPISAARWPSPVTGYTVTNHHGVNGHKGTDLAAPMGANIVNHLDAFVLRAFDCIECNVTGDGPQSINVDRLGDGYGTFAILRYDSLSAPADAQPHLERFIFVMYAHMSDLDVTQGFPVRADSRIGRVGSTGNLSGPHLHLEVRTSDTPNVNFYSARLIDPALLFNL